MRRSVPRDRSPARAPPIRPRVGVGRSDSAAAAPAAADANASASTVTPHAAEPPDQDGGDDLEQEREQHEPSRDRRTCQAGHESRACKLGEQRAAQRQHDHQQAGEPRLRGGHAHLVGEALLVLERAREPAKQHREVAAGAALNERRGHDRVDRGRRAAEPQRLERGVGGLPGGELGRHAPDLRAARASESGRRLEQRSAQRPPPGQRVGDGQRDRRRVALDRAAICQPARTQSAADHKRRRQRERGAGERPGQKRRRTERRDCPACQQLPALERTRLAPLATQRQERLHRRRRSAARLAARASSGRASSPPSRAARRTPIAPAQKASSDVAAHRAGVSRQTGRSPRSAKSSRVPTPPATRTTSATEVTRRSPPGRRAW